MTEPSEVDLSEIPVTALREGTRAQLELALNDRRVIPTDEGDIPRDWRGLAHFTGLDFQISPQSSNPTADILNLWGKDQSKRPSLKDLQNIFTQLDRWDVFYDTEELMVSDAKRYLESLQVKPTTQDSAQPLLYGCLTHEDVYRVQQGLELTDYDAFLLYADEDFKDAELMVEKLENDYQLRVFFKDRDLISGVGFEFQAMTQLIERCATVIVILSPAFVDSKINSYYLSFAQTLNIEQRKRIIQCIFKPCELPQLMKCMFSLSRARLENLNINFWERVHTSVQAALPSSTPRVPSHPSVEHKPEAKSSRCTITEITEETPTKAPVAGQTAIVRMSDPSTHYPGNSLENPLVLDVKCPSDEPSDFPDCENFSDVTMEDTSDGFMSRLKKNKWFPKEKWFKKEKNWFKKKKAVALVSA